MAMKPKNPMLAKVMGGGPKSVAAQYAAKPENMKSKNPALTKVMSGGGPKTVADQRVAQAGGIKPKNPALGKVMGGGLKSVADQYAAKAQLTPDKMFGAPGAGRKVR